MESDDRARRAGYVVLAIAVSVRVVAAVLVPLVPDETYYWEWSRHLAAGYLDHPPLIAFVTRFGTSILGPTPIGVRLGSVLAGALASLTVMHVSRALGGDRAALRAAMIVACMPLAQIGLALATPDAGLLLFWSLALWALVAALRGVATPRARAGAWSLVGLALGAALSSKYTAALLAAGIVAALLASATSRRALGTPGPYLAAALALLLFAPNLLWNARHGWASIDFQLAHGLAVHRGSPLGHELQLFGGQIALVSPLLLAALAIPAVRAVRWRDDATRTALAIIAATAWLVFVASALRSAVEPNWQAPAYLSAIVLAATYDGDTRWRTLLKSGCALGAAVTMLIYTHAVVRLIPANIAFDPTAAGFGWDTLAAHVNAERNARVAPPGATTWVAGERYQEASELAFHLADHPVTFAIDVHGRPNQYDLWPLFPERARKGDRLVIVLGRYTLAANDPVIRALTPHFDRVTLCEEVPLARGPTIRAWRRLWVLEGWHGSWPWAGLSR